MTARPAPRPTHPWPAVNLGLGLCFSCVGEYWNHWRAAGSAEGKHDTGPPPRPRYAVTMAPSLKPVPGEEPGTVAYMAMVTLPTCFEHLGAPRPPGNGQQQQRRPFLVAGGLPPV